MGFRIHSYYVYNIDTYLLRIYLLSLPTNRAQGQVLHTLQHAVLLMDGMGRRWPNTLWK
nr:hypothetical protein Q903MT_gene4862 [Picea sitchensis]